MPLIAIGVNHRSTPVEIRERLSVGAGALAETLQSIRAFDGIEGAAVISTCNRMEAILSASSEDVIEPMVGWFTQRASAERAELEKHVYVLRHGDVVKHLFRVASGLDSMILGEPQIGGQVRAAFMASKQNGAMDSLLTQLFDQTMRVAKKVRTETGIGESAVSVPYAAVELARKIFGDLSGLQVMLVGAGEMGEQTAESLASFGLQQVFVANRSYDRAVELAKRYNGEAIQFSGIAPYLETCDIVIASTAAPHYVIEAEHVELALAARRRRHLFLIDLSVPRNIDPAIAKIDGAYLYNIDDLQSVADSNRQLRLQRAEQAEAIVDKEVDSFRRRLVAQDAVPTILELKERLEIIRASELEKCLRKLGPITPEQHDAVAMLTTQMINKILHYPILQLKDVDEPERESLKQTIRKIFGLR